jgi:hypothetical protein
MYDPASEFLRESGLLRRDSGAGERIDNGVYGREIVGWDGRRCSSGDVFLLILADDLKEELVQPVRSSWEVRVLGSFKFFFQFRRALRSLSFSSSWSSPLSSGAREPIVLSRLSTPYMLFFAASLCLEIREEVEGIDCEASKVFSSAIKYVICGC